MNENGKQNRKKDPFRKLRSRLQELHIPTIALLFLLYFVLCIGCYVAMHEHGSDVSFLDVLLFNLLTITGNDYEFTDSTQGKLLGLLVLILGMVGLSTITGYISSALVASKLNLERGVKKMQTMKQHIIICGWKNDIKSLIMGILRKNKQLSPSDIILINNVDELKLQALRDDHELHGLNILKGDFTEEQTLMNANIKEAAKVLIVGENQESLDDELIDSRVFVSALLIRNLNPKCHICAELRTERYRNYLEAQNCAEVIYTAAYTQYILTTSTNYSGMSKVMSSFLDNGDGVSVQIAPIPEKWIGRTYGELFKWYKDTQNVLLLGVLENMGVEKEIKHSILSEAQKSTNYGEITQRLKSVKTMETNAPHLNPSDDFVLKSNTGAIILGEEI